MTVSKKRRPVDEAAAAEAGSAPAPAAAEAEKNRNLLQRVVTALVLLPLVLWLIWLGGEPFALLIAVAAVLSAIEFYEMSLGPDPLRVPGALAVFAMPFFFLVPWLGESRLHWLWAGLAAVALTQRLLRNAPVEGAGSQIAAVVLGAVYCSFLGYLVPLRLLGEASSWAGGAWVVLACVLTWGGDTGAYFAGRFFGRHKLYPRISPHKTWEGFFGGMATGIGGAFVVRALVLDSLTVADVLVLGVLAGIAGPLGDLVESMLKRSFRVKDSGTLLPGHGGMLDRIDALLFNAPVVYFYATLVVAARGG